MYQVRITKTAKRAGSNTDWNTYDREIKEFKTLADVKNYLFEDNYEYNKKTRIPMYADGKNGEAIKNGYIYRFNVKEYSRETGKLETYHEQHWVSVYKLNKVPVLA